MQKYLFFIVIFLSATLFVRGQQVDFISIVYLKNGTVLEGKLIEFRENQFIKMDLGGKEVTIAYDSVQKIKHKSLAGRTSRDYGFRERGLYNQTSVGFLPGRVSSQNVVGIQVDHSVGFLMNRWIGLGLNFGLQNYDEASTDFYYTVSGEARGYLFSRNFSPYYVLRGGYGFINRDETFVESNGGYYIHPGIGYRFSGSNNFSFVLEAGLSFQKAWYKQDMRNFWWGRGGSEIIERDLLYRRFSVKLGVLF